MTQTETSMTIEDAMRTRHSVRKYEKGVTIPEAELNQMIELAATAPSSWNLQHWRFLVVTEQANKDQLLPIAYNQQQVSDASAVIVILGDLEANKSFEEVYRPALEAGQIPQQAYDTLNQNVQAVYQGDQQTARDEANRNAAFAAMQLMLAAKAKGYDTCPIGGFDRTKLIAELNIPARFTPVMMMTLGKAAAPAHATGRFPIDKMIIQEKF
ncbi:nitroreductase family protein [Brevibacillus ginsengisoli]|uniref:nitroreductase family protein n=1 Tax=Brevibacillus ginsengisoli TaxID=363854 RepID=UPI003CFAED43